MDVTSRCLTLPSYWRAVLLCKDRLESASSKSTCIIGSHAHDVVGVRRKYHVCRGAAIGHSSTPLPRIQFTHVYLPTCPLAHSPICRPHLLIPHAPTCQPHSTNSNAWVRLVLCRSTCTVQITWNPLWWSLSSWPKESAIQTMLFGHRKWRGCT